MLVSELRDYRQKIPRPLDLILLLLALQLPWGIFAIKSQPPPSPPMMPINDGGIKISTLKGLLKYVTIAPDGFWLLSTVDKKGIEAIYLLPGQPIDVTSNVSIAAGNMISLTCILLVKSPPINECTNMFNARITSVLSLEINTANIITLRLLVVVVSLSASDECGAIGNQPGANATEVLNSFVKSNGIVDYFSDCSYGRMLIDRDALKVVSLKLKCTEFLLRRCNEWTMLQNLRIAAEEQLRLQTGITLASYTNTAYILHRNSINPCSWRGLGELPGKISMFTPEPTGIFKKGTVMQELLHNFGLYHGYDKDGNEYYDNTTAMGYGDSCPSAPELWRLGWAEPLVLLDSTSLPASTFKTFNLRATYLGPERVTVKITPEWLGRYYTKNLYLALRIKARGDRDLLDQFDGKLSIHQVQKEYDMRPSQGPDPKISLIGVISPRSSFNLPDYNLQILTGGLITQNNSIVVNICRYINSSSLEECSSSVSPGSPVPRPPQVKPPSPSSPSPPPPPRPSPNRPPQPMQFPAPPQSSSRRKSPPPSSGPLTSPPAASSSPTPLPPLSPRQPKPFPKNMTPARQPQTPPEGTASCQGIPPPAASPAASRPPQQSSRPPPSPSPSPPPPPPPSSSPSPSPPVPLLTPLTPLTPAPPRSTFTPGAVQCGWDFNCVLSIEGTIKCFGDKYGGQLGLGDTVPRGDRPGTMGPYLPTVDLGPNLKATAIATGGAHACALLQPGGIVKCWGANSHGQLGLGDSYFRGDGPGEMGSNLPALDLNTAGLTATAITAGEDHTCALLQPGGIVKCWGHNGDGELGLGDTNDRGDGPGEMGSNLPAVDLGTGFTATAITAAGGSHTCALLQPGGVVKCWGRNNKGQLGLGHFSDRGRIASQMGDNLPAVNLGHGYSATAVAAGREFTCALLQPGGVVKCWGWNANAQLGQGDYSLFLPAPSTLEPISLGRGYTATAIATGYYHACALLQPGGIIKCWGANWSGNLGLGDTNSRGYESTEMGDNLPSVNLGPAGLTTATAVAAGDNHTCALLQPGNIVKCWGGNEYGELGLEDINNRGDNLNEMGPNLPPVSLQ